MNDFEYELTRQLCDSCVASGIKPFSDDECCRALAWLYVYGGGNEHVITGRMYQITSYAQRRLNIFGNEIPDAELLPLLQSYMKSLHDEENPPDWVREFERKHGLSARGHK